MTCPNACVDGYIACWNPGGPCPDPRPINCRTCGICQHCAEERALAAEEPIRQALLEDAITEGYDPATGQYDDLSEQR